MAKHKITDKLKEGVSIEEIENFTRKYTNEVLAAAALIIGSVSSAFDWFTGPKLTIFFFMLGTLLGIFFQEAVDRGLKQLYAFTFKQEKTTQMILGAVKIIIAIFIPFVLFGMYGLFAGTAYHYFTHSSQYSQENLRSRSKKETSGEEHD